MNIVLIGMRGSGKSTVGKLLSKKLHKSFYDMDTLLAEKVDMTLPKFIEEHNWEVFRDKESEIAEEISKIHNIVVSTGGGVILREKNVDVLGNNGTFVFLKVSIDQIVKRIGKDKNRPSLTGKKSFIEELCDVWNERKSLYEKTANVTVDTDGKKPEEIVEEILKQL